MSEYDRNFSGEESSGDTAPDNPEKPGKVGPAEPERNDPQMADEDQTRIFLRRSRPRSSVMRFIRKAGRAISEADNILLGDEKPSSDKTVSRKTRRWGCLGAVLYFLFVVSTAALLAVVGWQAACDVLGLTGEDLLVQVTIEEDDTLLDVVTKLKESGMIRYPSLFKLYAEYSHAMDKIAPGTYTLSSEYDYRALVSGMMKYGTKKGTVDVTIPEGYTAEQIFTLLEEKEVCLKSDLETICADYDFKYSFLEGIGFGEPNRLEGYLFPDTYQFYIKDDAVSVIDKMLRNFDARLSDELRQAVTASGVPMRDIITIASMIEKEASVGIDRPLISSVIYNRLRIGMKLQIDATVLYALGEHKGIVTIEDTQFDDPYNTYVYYGLPPGPISNPGLESIKAAVSPADTEFFYYALREDGTHYFSKTYEEHQAFLNQQQAD